MKLHLVALMFIFSSCPVIASYSAHCLFKGEVLKQNITQGEKNDIYSVTLKIEIAIELLRSSPCQNFVGEEIEMSSWRYEGNTENWPSVGGSVNVEYMYEQYECGTDTEAIKVCESTDFIILNLDGF
jgi:hypothetical protein